MNDGRQGVHRLAVHQDVELYEVSRSVVDVVVVEGSEALGLGLELVVEIDDELGERHFILQEDSLLVEILELDVVTPPRANQLHDGADVAARRNNVEMD